MYLEEPPYGNAIENCTFSIIHEFDDCNFDDYSAHEYERYTRTLSFLFSETQIIVRKWFHYSRKD